MRGRFVKQNLWRMLIAAAMTACLALGAGLAQAADKSVAEELLDILKAKGQISDAEYNVLMKKALEEKAEWQQAVAGQQTPDSQMKQEIKEELKAEMGKQAQEAAKKQIAASKKPNDMRVYFKDGIHFATEDKKFTARIGGRVKIGAASWDGNDKVNDFNSDYPGHGSEVRLARIYVVGTAWTDGLFKVDVDFAGNKVSLKDAYIGMQNIPYVGTALVGNLKEPISFEKMMSDPSWTMIEPSFVNSLIPLRDVGLRLNNTMLGKRMTWAAGVFEKSSNNKASANWDDMIVTGRITGLPWYQDNGRYLLHLGGSYAHQFADENHPITFKAGPENHLAPKLVNTGKIAAKGIDTVVGELVVNMDNVYLQAEYAQNFIDRAEATNPSFYAWYAMAGWFITGEKRPYKTSDGVFGIVKPLKNFDLSGDGWGAWEIAARYDSIDLSDSGINGGSQQDLTAGVNWYLNPMVRLSFNYIHGWIDDETAGTATLDDGEVDVFGVQAAMKF